MQTETLAIVIAISAIFALFAGSLAWADFYSRGRPKPGATARSIAGGERAARASIGRANITVGGDLD